MNGRSLGHCSVLFAGFLGEFAFILLFLPVLQTYLPHVRHFGPGVAGYLLAAYGFARLLTQIPLGGVADILDQRLTFGIGYVAITLTGLILWVPVAPVFLVLAAAAYGTGHALADPLIPAALTAASEPREHGRLLSYLSLAQVAGLVAGLASGAYLADFSGSGTGFILVAGANALTALLLVLAPGHLAHGKALPPRSSAARSDARTALLDERVLYLFAVFFVLALTINLLSPDLTPFINQRLHSSLHVMVIYLIPAALAGLAAR
jgi:MFS family permease